MSTRKMITDDLWDAIAHLFPQRAGRRGRPWADHRLILEGICWRYRTGSPWRDLPEEFGPWQTVWKRHFRYATDGTYDAILRAVAQAGLIPEGTEESIEEFLAADSTIVRAHQHAAGARTDSAGAQATGHTGGRFELQGSADRAC